MTTLPYLDSSLYGCHLPFVQHQTDSLTEVIHQSLKFPAFFLPAGSRCEYWQRASFGISVGSIDGNQCAERVSRAALTWV